MRQPQTKTDIISKFGYDINLIRQIQPAGGISFRDERYIQAGDGFEAILHIYQYPKIVNRYWLSEVCNIINAIVTVDISTEDTNTVRTNINKSISEQNSRVSSAKDITAIIDAQRRIQELTQLHQELTIMGEVLKLIDIRLILAARTVQELEEIVKKTQNYLESRGYKSAIYLNENKEEYLSVYYPYEIQQQGLNKRYGQPITSEALAGGDPFHYSSLSDPTGTHLGTALNTNGEIMFDMFTKTDTRMSYNALVIGNMGAGKSTTLKKLLLDQAIRGNYIRGFDPKDEYVDLIQALGGKMIYLDGSQGILNALEILKTDENEANCFSRHLSKLITIYHFLSPSAPSTEIFALEKLLHEFYESIGLSPAEGKQLTGLSSKEYPIWSDFLSFIDRAIQASYTVKGAVKTALITKEAENYARIREVIHSLVYNYGNIFNGHTSIDNILDTQIVFFNIKNLEGLKEEVFDAQIFIALALCWDNCVKIGTRMKNLYDKNQIPWEDITRFTIFIDEAHKIINTDKIHAVEQLIVFEREARKFFGGLMYATQSIRDFVPEGNSSESINKIKTLFELTQYKFIFQQDNNVLPLLNNVFQYQLAESQLRRIPRLSKGECILTITSDQTIAFKIDVTDQELNLFAGGA